LTNTNFTHSDIFFIYLYDIYINHSQKYNRNPNSWVYDQINQLNGDIIESVGYNNYILPLSYRIRRFLDDAINQAENNNQRTLSEFYRLIDNEIKNFANNPILIIFNILGFRFLWRYYFSTRLNIHNMTLNSIKFTSLRTNNRLVYTTIKLIHQINLKRRFFTMNIQKIQLITKQFSKDNYYSCF
jgi:hypothetical protein